VTKRTWDHPRYAVIPTTGRECYDQALAAITPQVDDVFAIWAPRYQAEEDWVKAPPDGHLVAGIGIDEKRNISRWWNIGIDRCKEEARRAGAARWDIAILNDDVIVPADWFDRVAGTMRSMKVAAGSMSTVGMTTLHTRPGNTALWQRMQGFAFILAGELGVRADESLEWWCGDNDIDMQSRLKGGTVLIPDTGVKHLYPDQSTDGVLREQTAVDMQRFVQKWGFRPWSL
jgi:hypothetical protein